MADPLSLSAGLVALVTFGLQTTSSLLNEIREFKRAPRSVRELAEELQALIEVLYALETTIQSPNTDFTALDLPLRRCAKACQNFHEILDERAGRGEGAKSNFQDWVKLKWLGSDINGFKDTIASYKLTISVALCNANLRVSRVTKEAFDQYKEMISHTTSDLNSRLQDIDEKLQQLLLRHRDGTKDDPSACQQMQEEKESILKCLEICNHVSSKIEALQDSIAQQGPDSTAFIKSTDPLPASTLFTTADNLAGYGNQLEINLQRLRELLRLRSAAKQPASSSEQQDLLYEIEGLQRSIQICEDAARDAEKNRPNVFEDVSAGDDARQVLISTVGHLIFARGVKAGARAVQAFGQMSDESVQHIIPSGADVAPEQYQGPQSFKERFAERHGSGRGLGTGSTANAGYERSERAE